jgi:hypothetical protein
MEDGMAMEHRMRVSKALVTAIGWCCLLGYAIHLIADAWWDSRPLNILQVIAVPVLLLVVIRAIRRYLPFRADA